MNHFHSQTTQTTKTALDATLTGRTPDGHPKVSVGLFGTLEDLYELWASVGERMAANAHISPVILAMRLLMEHETEFQQMLGQIGTVVHLSPEQTAELLSHRPKA